MRIRNHFSYAAEKTVEFYHSTQCGLVLPSISPSSIMRSWEMLNKHVQSQRRPSKAQSKLLMSAQRSISKRLNQLLSYSEKI